MHRLLIPWILLLILAPAAAEPAPPAPAPYRVAPEDVLEITVLNQPELSKTVTVLPDGTISYPYLGESRVAGLTVRELTRRLAAALDTQFVRPQVTVSVRERQPAQVSVLGAVKTPGKRALRPGWRVLDIIADCGGLSVDRPEWVSAALVCGGGKQAVSLDMARLLTLADPKDNPLLETGDILLIQELDPSRREVRVLGEVSRPGPVPAPRDGSVVAVLTAAGGPTPRAALSRVAILRGAKTLPLDLGGLVTGAGVVEGIRLEPGDTLVVPQNRHWYAVFGAVRAPGYLDYPEGESLTVLSALSRSGGQAPDADVKSATLVRPAKQGKPLLVAVNLEDMLKRGDLSKDLPVRPGDILFVPAKKQGGGLRLADILSVLPFVNLLAR